MKKTITLSLLFATATCCYAESDLVDLSFDNGAITLSPTQESVNVSGKDKDSLISSTLPEDVSAGTVLGQIKFTISTTSDSIGNVTFGTPQNILSITSTTGTAYSVSVVYTEVGGTKAGQYNAGYLVLNVGSETIGDENNLEFMDTRTYDASITLVANGSTAAEGVTITLQLTAQDNETKSIAISTSSALTGSFADMVVGGGQTTGSVTVTSVKAHKTAASDDDDAVPEPTTATLSLLALAGLAARRRRK